MKLVKILTCISSENCGKMTIIMTKYIERKLSAPQQSFFLFGPRGTGKTTWVDHEFKNAHQINLLNESLYQSYLADISQFGNELRVLKPGSLVFVDEIQRLPNLLNEVHQKSGRCDKTLNCML